MTVPPPNPLVIANRADSGALQVHLHPLVLLTISDFVTRHTVRGLKTPIIGAILGQQNGREVSLEYAFECKAKADNDVIRLDPEWFEKRTQQYKQVHKVPPLDIVGWFTTTPVNGPQEHHLPIHRQILQFYNDSAVLLAFHPTELSSQSNDGGKLPLTIYESVSEGPEGQMEVEGQDSQDRIRFKELSYSVETGEAEMISVDFVARGGGNATVTTNGGLSDTQPTEMEVDSREPVSGKGKGKLAVKEEVKQVDILSHEDEELIATLTAKANAVRMLHSRIQLLSRYLKCLPSSNNEAQSAGDKEPDQSENGTITVNHEILRSIQAIVNRLPLVVPSDSAAFQEELVAEKKDVSIAALLGSLNRSIKDVRDLGHKHFLIESTKAQSKRGQMDDNLAKLGLMTEDYEGYLGFASGSRRAHPARLYD